MEHISVKPPVELSGANRCAPALNSLMEGSENALPDEKLVERSLRGEEDAFRDLYERYRQCIYSAVYRIISDSEEAQDVVQEIFMAVHRYLKIWSPQRAKLLPWIYRIAINRAIDHWRARCRRAELPLAQILETQSRSSTLRSEATEPIERTVERRERVADIWRFVKALPQPQRRFVILRYRDGLKLKEIAEKEGCKLGTVKSALHRATNTVRFKLRCQYKRCYVMS